MDTRKKQKLEKAGWKFGNAQEFLGLSDDEMRLVEIKRCLMNAVRQKRKKRKISQEKLAGLTGSSQSRIAKLEAASGDVSMDLILRVLISLGATDKEIAGAIAGGSFTTENHKEARRTTEE